MNIITELQQTPLFKGVEASDLEELQKFMERATYAEGEILFRQGEVGLTMYLIVSGRVRIFIYDEQGNEVPFRMYKAGDVVGEFAILDQRPRSATAVAVEPLDVLVLHREAFMTFLKERPLVGLAMMRSIAERIRYTTSYLEKIIDWTQWLSRGNYEQAIVEMAPANDDDEIQTLIKTFLDMVHSIRAREAQLKNRANSAGSETHSTGEESRN